MSIKETISDAFWNAVADVHDIKLAIDDKKESKKSAEQKAFEKEIKEELKKVREEDI